MEHRREVSRSQSDPAPHVSRQEVGFVDVVPCFSDFLCFKLRLTFRV